MQSEGWGMPESGDKPHLCSCGLPCRQFSLVYLEDPHEGMFCSVCVHSPRLAVSLTKVPPPPLDVDDGLPSVRLLRSPV